MRRLGVNTISNIATKLWSTISIYLFVPLYIKYLGETSYGLVSFFTTLQAALNLLGLGLSNTLRREFAVGDSHSESNSVRKYKLLRSVELVYIILGILMFAICSFGSRFIAANWLNVESLEPKVVSSVISLMGLSIALQMMANLYAGCMFGLEYQVKANLYCIGWSVLKSVGSLLTIIFIKPDLVYFYSWHILVDVCYMTVLRFFSIKLLGIEQKIKWSIYEIKNLEYIWKYAGGILMISFIALINKQLDKVIISKFLTLTDLGAYNIATTLGGLSTILPSALYTSVFPGFTYKASNRKLLNSLNSEFLVINKITSIIISCFGAFIAAFASQLIYLWTRSDIYMSSLYIVGPIVVFAVSMIEYQEIPYALALAHGNTKINVFVGLVFVPIVSVTTWIGIKYFGLIGAALVYLIMMCCQTLLYVYLVIKQYISGNTVFIMLRDLILPLAASLVLAFGSRKIIISSTDSIICEVILAILCGFVSLVCILFMFGRKELEKILLYYKNRI